MKANNAPIGVFDSGLGGLTVVHEITRQLPAESIVYLGDTARVPYGIRSPETVRRYAREGAEFLLSRGIKLMVVACNTVSAVGLDEVARISPVPVVGVILPGARAAAGRSHKGKVGVIGTEATIRSGAYVDAIRSQDDAAEVFTKACPLFVPLVEEGWLDGDVPLGAAAHYMEELKARKIDVLVLGCTHYPLLKPVLRRVMGEGVELIDSARETASEVSALIRRNGTLADDAMSGKRRHEFFVTDAPEKFREVGQLFLGEPIEHIEKVSLEVYTCAAMDEKTASSGR
jgi:glutamate racemase